MRRSIGSSAFEYVPLEPFEVRLVALTEVEPPERLGDVVRFRPDRTRHILVGMACGDPLPPVRVVEMPVDSYNYRVRDGFHRFYLSIVCGFTHLPIAVDPWNEEWMWRHQGQ